MKNVVINGRVLLFPTNGIPRYATEIIRYIDQHMIDNINIEVVIPDGLFPKLELKNIKYTFLRKFFAWDYTIAERYAKNKGALYINLASKGTLYRNSIATIFDIRPLSFDPTPTSFRAFRYYCKFAFSFFLASKNAKHIVTISDFCKKEIIEHSGRCDSDISVIGCGWDHINHIEIDERVFEDFPELASGNYFLSIGSVAPHKNFKWIIEVAKKNPNHKFVIVGKTDPSLWEDTTKDFKQNIVYVGYQSDEKMKALLLKSKALVFPSLYEGFGIPPIEAAGCNIHSIVSDIPVMREIMQEHAIYINPYKTDYDLSSLFQFENHSDIKSWLEKLTWNTQGQKWIDLISNYTK